MDATIVDSLKSELYAIKKDTLAYFESMGPMEEDTGDLFIDDEPLVTWNSLNDAQRGVSQTIRSNLAVFGVRLIEAVRLSTFGYAHASGKRPILFREEGKRLHFDLLVHNVPAYKNTTDLKAKLRVRLSAMLGKSPRKEK
jgi:hypothetical protein